jgi:hypothetical protein
MCPPICKTEGDDLCAHENPSSAIEISPANESDIKYAVMLDSRASMIRHARPRAGHPRLADAPKAWMAGTSPAMTEEVARIKCAIQKCPGIEKPAAGSARA